MKHKHADVLIAIAEGKDVQCMSTFSLDWIDIDEGSKINPIRYPEYKWRIKPEHEPDIVRYVRCDVEMEDYYPTSYIAKCDNLKLTFDGETGKLKTAEVL